MGSLPLDPEQHRWILNWLNSPIYTNITLIMSGSQIIVMSCLLITYIYKLYATKSWMSIRTKKQNDGFPFVNNVIHIITIICILFALFSGILTFINNLAIINSDDTCLPITISLQLCWLISKVCIYNVCWLRLQTVFWGTQYQYSKTFMCVIHILINTVFIVSVIGTFLHVSSIHYAEIGQPGWCLYIIPSYLIFLPACIDVSFTPVTMILFVKPINKLLQSEFVIKKENDIKQIVTKYVLLSSIAIFSNVFSSVWFGITDIVLFNDIDIMINPFCLALMQTSHSHLYYFICKCCHHVLNKHLHNGKTENQIIQLKKNQNQTVELKKKESTNAINESTMQNNTLPTNTSVVNEQNNERITTFTQNNIDNIPNIENGKVISYVHEFDDEFDSQRTTTSDLERGEFRRKYIYDPSGYQKTPQLLEKSTQIAGFENK